MKTLTLILFLFCCINLQAQTYSEDKKTAIIGASVLVVTFTTLEIKGDNMTYLGRSTVAMSGIAISAGYSLYKTTKVGKKISRYFKMKRNKKINYIVKNERRKI